MSTQLIYDLSPTDLKSLVNDWGEPSYRAQQIWQGVYLNFWNKPDEFTNLPTHMRKKLFESVEFNVLVPVKTIQSSDCKTEKALFQLHDGRAIETVLMKYDQATVIQHSIGVRSRHERRTLCISTQVGCAMGCVFCATGQMGFKRHLSSGEIVAQVLYFARQLRDRDEVVTNVVVMGMGEPFHNYDNTLAAIDRLNDPEGYNLGARRFTISTVGLVPMIRRFADEKRQVNLAISLHAADDEERSNILPVNKKYNISKLLEACRYYVDQTGRRIT